MVEGKTKLYANLSQCRKNAKMNSNATRFISTEKGIYSPKGHLYISLYISLSPSHLFLYRSNTEESDVLISKERYIHLYEEYSDNNKLSSAPWLTYTDRVSVQHHRTQRISQRRRYILMREMAFLRHLYRLYKYRQGALLQGWPGLTVMINAQFDHDTHLSYGNKLFYYDSNTQSHFFLKAKYKKSEERWSAWEFETLWPCRAVKPSCRDVCFH